MKLVAVNQEGRRIGEDHPRARLTDTEIEIAIQLHAEGWGYARVADKFGVSKQAVKQWVVGSRRAQYPTGFKRVIIKRR